MSLLTDVNDIFFHKKIYNVLKKMSNDMAIPHIIFYGPCGSGKRTMVSTFLKMIYGENVNTLFSASYDISGSGNKVKKEIVKNSNHHIIINPTNTNFDKYLVHEIIKGYASSKSSDLIKNPDSKFKTVQISNLEKLSHSAQTSLRRMIEVNSSFCRFIMWCENLSNVIEPLKSRCVCIRVSRPTFEELFTYLFHITIINKISMYIKTITDIIHFSECNITTALLCVETFRLKCVYRTNRCLAIDELTNLIVKCQINKIDKIRDMFYNMWITYYEGIDIVKYILKEIIKLKIPEICKAKIILKTSVIEYDMVRSRRQIMGFDNFVISVMKIIYMYS